MTLASKRSTGKNKGKFNRDEPGMVHLEEIIRTDGK